ncbi:hypothetical protein HDZ31DRAFT_59636 [Schizophyllum fasciatum]
MPPRATKRKSDVIDSDSEVEIVSGPGEGNSASPAPAAAPAKKRARKADDAEDEGDKPKRWQDIKLEGEDEGEVPVYDDCAEVRRKIRLLEKTPGFVKTRWLKEIGNVNSNSYGRFMAAKERDAGGGNSTYPKAYIYFEKMRILEGKKKTAGRIRNEQTHPDGFPLENRRTHMWVFTGVPRR